MKQSLEKLRYLSLLIYYLFFLLSKGVAQEIIILPDTVRLDEVIVVGYATGSEATISGAIDKVKEEDMNRGLITTPFDALRGRVTGLYIPPANNGPAALEAVRIRGTTSLTGGNDPLVIIDGIFGDLSLLRAVYPADIESFTVLKDASETAQYGSRGASGVIEVTTKKGKAGLFNITYEGNFGISSVARHLRMLSGDEFRQVARERQIEILDQGYNTNFLEEITQTALLQTHHIAFGGGSEHSNYRASVGYVDQQGVIRNNSSRNYTAKLDITQRAFNNRLTLDIGMFGSLLDMHYLNDYQKTFYSAATFNPTFPNHKNPETGGWDMVTTASQITHPIAWMDVQDDEANALVNARMRVVVQLTDHWKLTGFGSYTYNSVENSHYKPTTVWGGGEAFRGLKKTQSLLGNLMIQYKKDWRGNHLDILALAEAQKTTLSGFHTTVTNFKTNQYGYHNLQAGAVRLWEGTASYFEDPRLVSFLGRVNYVHKGRYIATLNARADASSKIGINNKWGFFPSASLAWTMSEEAFMKPITWLNNLKLRIGYGLSGNQDAIQSYTSMQLLKPSGVVSAGGAPTVTMGLIRNANPDLRWEVKHTFNSGFDLGILENWLMLKMDYYISRTHDMLYLYDVSVPPFAYNKLLANLGSMENKGLEVALGITPWQTADTELQVNATFSRQKNKLLSLSGTYRGEKMSAPEQMPITNLDGAGFHGGYNYIVYQIVGEPVGVFYLPKCTGLEELPNGGYRYAIADLDGGGVNLEEGGDRYIAGQAMPKVLMGTNISFRHKRLDLSLQINGAFGHKIYNGTSLTYMNMNIFPDYNVMREAPRRHIYDQTVTDYWLERGDYINFDYLTIGWNVPLSGRLKPYIQSLRLSGSVNNLLTITGYSGFSPMINSYVVNNTLGTDDKRNYPVTRSYSIGLSIKF
ncbi:SusC/RagA family TonB-linked outer membrane protein [Parabacteroides sp. PFB2-10]|uniref:SusC/RagA family TonB-linked outer membrane protein n=1 Tax=Parabacteroides sp. PFB2-10 TaxID=1742405 RepID=UPI0024755048|nr:SusC/RagA family TonB-linked outer membrane protein [Parabacteroides sp. PFB2-10]